jgi:hypothetical protein
MVPIAVKALLRMATICGKIWAFAGPLVAK